MLSQKKTHNRLLESERENVGYLCFRRAGVLQKLALTAVHVRGRHFSLFHRLLWR